jgi:hypothetical protein
MKKIAITITSLIISIKTTALYAITPITPPLGEGTDLRTIFMNVLDVAQTIVIMATTLYLIYAGFMFVTAKGDPGKIKTARDALLWGLIGAALILMAEVLALGIGDTVKEVFRGN